MYWWDWVLIVVLAIVVIGGLYLAYKKDKSWDETDV